MKIRTTSWGNHLIFQNEMETVEISIKEGIKDFGDPPIIIDLSDQFVKFIRLKGTNVFRLLVFKDKATLQKQIKAWRQLYRNKKEILEGNKRAEVSWQVLFMGGKK